MVSISIWIQSLKVHSAVFIVIEFSCTVTELFHTTEYLLGFISQNWIRIKALAGIELSIVILNLALKISPIRQNDISICGIDKIGKILLWQNKPGQIYQFAPGMGFS
jgi:hypothetical protein